MGVKEDVGKNFQNPHGSWNGRDHKELIEALEAEGVVIEYSGGPLTIAPEDMPTNYGQMRAIIAQNNVTMTWYTAAEMEARRAQLVIDRS